jgi:hypothetical protein
MGLGTVLASQITVLTNAIFSSVDEILNIAEKLGVGAQHILPMVTGGGSDLLINLTTPEAMSRAVQGIVGKISGKVGD